MVVGDGLIIGLKEDDLSPSPLSFGEWTRLTLTLSYDGSEKLTCVFLSTSAFVRPESIFITS